MTKMKPEFLGARASNTGDDFHEWWALRLALQLLDPDTSLTAVTVEGVNLDDNNGQELTEWDSVDCGLFYGGHTVEQAQKVIFEQLKYSSSTPKKNWTVSELTSSKSKASNNSILKGLADSFLAILRDRPELIRANGLTIKLVSNRAIGADLRKSLSDSNYKKHETLRIASGLNKRDFKKFITLFDFSDCGTGSRFEQEENAINEILDLTHSADRGFVLDLKDRIHKLMLPEATGSYITRETVLTWMNVSDPLALFPCPPKLKTVENSVNRNAAVTIQTTITNGEQFICLHGEGGSGKTTLLKQVESLLPEGSTMVIYDCYGAGTYMDSEAYRHRPKDAYLQIINETSARLRLPLLISQDLSIDFLKAFSLKIESASKVLKAQSGDALLVIVIDAADNSVTGAKQCKPEETSFVHELIKIGNLPSNVRLMISARTGRLESLSIPDKYNSIEISNFSLEETAFNVFCQYPSATDTWIEDFHNLSNQNPRVQSYALDYAGSDLSKAIDFLRPNGKGLDQIFEARFEEAILKEGDKDTLSLVCSSLIALPMPVPKQHLASVVGISIERINDIVSDLPGMRVLEDEVGFFDEDVEFFVREKAQPKMREAYQRSADYFYANHENDEYSAMHLASALFSSDRGQKLIEIIEKNEAPSIIKDQIIRREVQRQRLQLAMKVCRSAGDPADAIFTLLVGAEAIKTDDAVDKIITENPDLSVHFASDTVGRNILYSSKTYETHGRFLSHIMARDAADKDFIAAREKKRILREWMNRRSEDLERIEIEQSYQHTDPWPIELEDIAAIAHSVLDMEGYQAAYNFICSWKPKKIHYEVAIILIDRLLSSGKAITIQEFLDSGCVPEPWSSLFGIPLALVGHSIDCAALEKALCNQKILKYCDLQAFERHTSEDNGAFSFVEMILCGCEVLAANGACLSSVEHILEYLCPSSWRLVNNIYTHNILKNDISFRAYSLLMRHRDLDVTIESYWIDSVIPEDLDEITKKRKNKKSSEKHKEIKESLSNLISVYAVRADMLLSNILPEYAKEKAKSALESMFSNSWRMSREHYFESICSRLSLSVAGLSVIPDIDTNTVLALSKACFKEWPFVYSSGQRKVISKLIKIPELRLLVIKDIYGRSVEVKELKTAASEKISILLDLSRILLFVNKDEAREVFKIAVDIANDVDVDAMHDVSLFSALSKNAKNHFSVERSQQTANQMAALITEYATLLDGYEHFPWRDAISAVATLDMAKAISLIGYWEDCELVSAAETLPELMSTGVSEKTITPVQAVSLLNFCDDLNGEFLAKLVSITSPQDACQLIEEVAKSELLRFNRTGSVEVCQVLNELIPYDDKCGYWHDALNKSIHFNEKNNENGKDNVLNTGVDSKSRKIKEEEFLENIDLKNFSPGSPAEFLDLLNTKREGARSESLYIGHDTIMKSIASNVEPKDRVAFLTLLIDERVVDDIGYTWAKILVDCLDLWRVSSHAISFWGEENLPVLITKYLGEFTYCESYGHDRVLLKDVLDSLALGNKNTVSLLLDGLERNSESLPLPKLYSVIKILIHYCSNEQIANVTTRYIQRLSNRLKLSENMIDSEYSVESALACQLYSFLGDVDTRVRWRAAHSIRASARMGDFKTILALTDLYGSKTMSGYREDDVPFYWLSARLWLIVTFDRISSEVPEAVVPIARWLFRIATDQDFPHVLIRHFAKSSLMKLLSSGFNEFNDQEVTAINAINTSELAEEPKRRLARGGHERQKERRFHFDHLDTVNHVYPGAINCFANLDQEMFLDEAEGWIIDQWKYDGSSAAWKNEPRKHLFERANYNLYSHRQGSKPTIEPLSYYLEWHSMWCSVGSLMKRKAIVKHQYNDYGALEELLKWKCLTQGPHWSSDLRMPKPLELRFHKPPILETEAGVPKISDDDFDLELGLTSSDNNLIVDSYQSMRTSGHSSTVSISSSIVNPDTGLSLVRALQASENPSDYLLPPSGHELEIDDDPYLLCGWLRELSGDSLLDGKDTFNHNVRMIECCPSNEVVKILRLSQSNNYPVSWFDDVTGEIIFLYEAWGDVKESYQEREYIHEGDVVSNGHRLKILPRSLKQYLCEVGLDLIVKVEISRRANKNELIEHNDDSEKEEQRTKLYLLRRNGEIFTTEGCIGAWAPSDI